MANGKWQKVISRMAKKARNSSTGTKIMNISRLRGGSGAAPGRPRAAAKARAAAQKPARQRKTPGGRGPGAAPLVSPLFSFRPLLAPIMCVATPIHTASRRPTDQRRDSSCPSGPGGAAPTPISGGWIGRPTGHAVGRTGQPKSRSGCGGHNRREGNGHHRHDISGNVAP